MSPAVSSRPRAHPAPALAGDEEHRGPICDTRWLTARGIPGLPRARHGGPRRPTNLPARHVPRRITSGSRPGRSAPATRGCARPEGACRATRGRWPPRASRRGTSRGSPRARRVAGRAERVPIAPAQEERAATRPKHRAEAGRVARTFGIAQGVEEPHVEDRVERPAQCREVQRVRDQELHAGMPRGRSPSQLARSIAAAATSTPTTAWPSAARWSAFSPGPAPRVEHRSGDQPLGGEPDQRALRPSTSQVGLPPSRYALSKNATMRRLRRERYLVPAGSRGLP